MQDITLNESTAALRRIFFVAVDVTDGVTRLTGLTFSGSEIMISKNGAAAAAFGGSVTEVDSGDIPGLYYYECTAGEVDTEGVLTLKIAGSLMATQEIAVEIKASSAAPSAASIADAVWDEARSGHTTAGTFGEGTIVYSIVNGAITAASIASDAITAAKVAADVSTEIASAVWGGIVEDVHSFADMLRMIFAMVAGEGTFPSGDGSYNAKSIDGLTTRVSGTMSGSTRTISGLDGT